MASADVPGDLVTQSGGGIDPHLSPAAVQVQIARVTRSRGVDAAVIERLVARVVNAPDGDDALQLLLLMRSSGDENADGIAETLEDDAEVWALDAVLILLEKALDEPLAENFDKILKGARKRLREASGPWPWDASGEEQAP